MSHFVYCVTHVPSGRRYVGKTSKKNPLQRWKDHQWEAIHGKQACRHFHRAIQKYGPDTFRFDVLEDCETSDDAYRRESWWIAFFRSSVTEHGFNIIEEYSKHVSLETREKLRRANLGKKHTPESRAKMSASRRGVKVGPYSAERRATLSAVWKRLWAEGKGHLPGSTKGKPLSPETRAKLSAAARKRYEDPDARATLSELLKNAQKKRWANAPAE